MLELARAACVEAEVALQRIVELHAGRHVDKRAARPHGTVQGRELVVGGRDELHEVVVDNALPLGVLQRFLDARVDDAHLGGGLLHGVVHELRVVLRAHAGKIATLGLWDAQAVEGVLDVLGDVIPARLLVGFGFHVGDDVVHVEAVDRRAPGGDGKAVVDVE